MDKSIMFEKRLSIYGRIWKQESNKIAGIGANYKDNVPLEFKFSGRIWKQGESFE